MLFLHAVGNITSIYDLSYSIMVFVRCLYISRLIVLPQNVRRLLYLETYSSSMKTWYILSIRS